MLPGNPKFVHCMHAHLCNELLGNVEACAGVRSENQVVGVGIAGVGTHKQRVWRRGPSRYSYLHGEHHIQ